MKLLLIYLLLSALLMSCTASPDPDGTPPESPPAPEGPARGAIMAAEAKILDLPDRTPPFEPLPETIGESDIYFHPSDVEIGYVASDPAAIYERFPEIITARAAEVGIAQQHYSRVRSPLTIEVEAVWKGDFFQPGEQITLFACGGYLPVGESILWKRLQRKEEKEWIFEAYDGRGFPEKGKTYLMHLDIRDEGEAVLYGWGLELQEINPQSGRLPSGETVEEYMRKLQ